MWLLIVQIFVWIALFISLGQAARGWLNVWGVVLAIGIAIGTVLPLLAAPRTAKGLRAMPAAAALVLAGGFMVRMAIVFVPEAIAP
jgi:formate-dependent nitrite reductase membrane component NrfD